LGHWKNVYLATKSIYVRNNSVNMFTPSVMPIRPINPDCNHAPIAIVQGSLERRWLDEIVSILNSKEDIKIRLLTRSDRRRYSWSIDKRCDFQHSLNMTRYHEAFLGAAFILPLIAPKNTHFAKSQSYYQGHPTSTIAYALNFGLRVIGHQDIHEAYQTDLNNSQGYWHNGSRESVINAVHNALIDFKEWCRRMDKDKEHWYNEDLNRS
jgi:hypothetical protein